MKMVRRGEMMMATRKINRMMVRVMKETKKSKKKMKKGRRGRNRTSRNRRVMMNRKKLINHKNPLILKGIKFRSNKMMWWKLIRNQEERAKKLKNKILALKLRKNNKRHRWMTMNPCQLHKFPRQLQPQKRRNNWWMPERRRTMRMNYLNIRKRMFSILTTMMKTLNKLKWNRKKISWSTQTEIKRQDRLGILDCACPWQIEVVI